MRACAVLLLLLLASLALPASAATGHVELAMVPLKSAKAPDWARVEKALRAAGFAPRGQVDREKSGLTLALGDGSSLWIHHLPAPIPWSELEGPCQTTFMWEEAEKALKPHKSHLLVAYRNGKGRAVERNLVLTRAVAAALRSSDAAGVYWGAAPLVQSPRIFLEMSAQAGPQELPLLLWVDFRLGAGQSPGTVTLVTYGLDRLGQREIEIRDSTHPGRKLVALAYDVAHYALTSGQTIQDGDTVGATDAQRIRARIRPSLTEVGKKSLVLEY